MSKEGTTNIYLGGVLGAGKHAIVSLEDYPLLSQYSWHLNKSGYAITKIKGRHKAMHRMVLGTTNPYVFVDHVDKDRLNNTRENLRELTPKENANAMYINASSFNLALASSASFLVITPLPVDHCSKLSTPNIDCCCLLLNVEKM